MDPAPGDSSPREPWLEGQWLDAEATAPLEPLRRSRSAGRLSPRDLSRERSPSTPRAPLVPKGLPEEQLADRVEYYRPQLETYGRVVAAQTGLAVSKIRLRLVFLELGRVVKIQGGVGS